MNSNVIIETVGYIGSFLVLVSFLMVSVVKLRVVNTIGSIIFMIYAFIIKSYPTAIMNFFLVLINLHFLYRMSRNDEREYDLVRVKKDDSYLQYFIDAHKDDINNLFPGTDLSFNEMNKGYIVVCEGKPAGLTIGKLEDGKMNLLLDYSIPEYRDFSIGNYLIPKIKEEGISELVYSGSTEHHLEYLEKMGFHQENDKYIKKL